MLFHIGLAKMNTSNIPEITHVLESMNVIREHIISIDERLTRIEMSLQQPIQTRREIRFEQLDPVYTRLMNLACLRVAKQKIENRQRGIRQHLQMPYEQLNSKSMQMKIRNYMKAITNEGNFGGRPGNRYATQTIRVLVTLNPSYDEIDEAAQYYRNRA